MSGTNLLLGNLQMTRSRGIRRACAKPPLASWFPKLSWRRLLPELFRVRDSIAIATTLEAAATPKHHSCRNRLRNPPEAPQRARGCGTLLVAAREPTAFRVFRSNYDESARAFCEPRDRSNPVVRLQSNQKQPRERTVFPSSLFAKHGKLLFVRLPEASQKQFLAQAGLPKHI